MDMIGEVERRLANVTVGDTGMLAELNVQPYQNVAAGQQLALIAPPQPGILAASLEVVRAEIELLRAGLDPVVGRRRAEFDQQRLLLDAMDQRVDLAIANARLTVAEATFRRMERLRETGGISETEFDTARTEFLALQAESQSRAALLENLERDLAALRLPAGDGPDGADPVAAAVAVQEKILAQTTAELGPVPLLAPIDGVVGAIVRQQGEIVPGGEVLFSIMAPKPERLVGYLKQPLARVPTVGTEVEIVTRTQPRTRAIGRVVHVSPHFEPLPPSVFFGSSQALPLAASTIVLGLPVVVQPPASLALRPGELVDMQFR
jgi:multidrug resistance efflux pump